MAHFDGPDRVDEKAGLKLPLVTVVVVCFNHANYIMACLRSIASQAYPCLQMIVVDNASTDASADVIRSFADELGSRKPGLRFQSILSNDNGHEMGAILQAFPHVKGRYVMFVDGDDLLLPGCITTHIKAHLVSRIAVGLTSVDMYQSTGDEIVVATGPSVSGFVMSRRGQSADFCRMSNLDAFVFPEEPNTDLTAKQLHYLPAARANEWVWSPSSGLCFRFEAAALLLDPPPTLRAGADNYLVRGICALTGGITIDRALAVYRLHGANFFSKHPALANLNTFDRTERNDLDVKVMGAIVASYRANMDDLSQNLETPDLYIEGIDHFADIAPGLKGKHNLSSYSLSFLLENREAIIRNFGASRYRSWVGRRLRPKDIVPLLSRLADRHRASRKPFRD